MCGIVAAFTKGQSGFLQEHKDVFATLLLLDTLRGEDSTGAFLINNQGEVNLAKEAKTGGEFLKSKEYKDIAKEAWNCGAGIIGHNRKATRGTINDENAHPFVVDDKIVLVHNGGIWGDHKKHADVEVDSHAIAHLLSENSVDDALSQFHGAYALMWYNVEEEAVHVVRNKERPLWFMETHTGWYWASEALFLHFAARRCNLTVKREPTALEEDSLNSLYLKDKKWFPSNRKINFNRAKYFPPIQVETKGNLGNEGGSGKHGPDRVNNDWMERLRNLDGTWEGAVNDDDIPFDTSQEAKDLVEGLKNFKRPSGALARAFLFTVGGNNYAYTSEFERELAKGCNKMITISEFNREIANSREYMWGTKIKATGFEYTDDGTGGFYLYSSPNDDPQVIIRHHFPAHSKPQEERIMHMALNQYQLEFVVDKKCWSPFADGKGVSEEPTREGYCVVLSSGCKILDGGGIKSEDTVNA